MDAIFKGMRWLGLDWDEGPLSASDPNAHSGDHGPYFQMQRLDGYRAAADRLIAEGKAYPCYCTAEEVDAMREKALKEKRNPRYDGTCRRLTEAQRRERAAQGRTASVRFSAPPEGSVEFDDLIRGPMKFDNEQIEDFILLKTSGVPTYNFACVVDDHAMEITHVIRGDDHLSNTPRQVLAYRALGWTPPVFAHLSMILGADGSRLSKRHGATSVEEYRQAGYLPEAVLNYLALLGWATSDSQDIFGKEELVAKFDVGRCSKSPAVFDPNKLIWMNGEYLRKMPAKELAVRARPFVASAGLLDDAGLAARAAELEVAVAMEQEKVKLLTDVPKRIDIFFKDVAYDPEAVEKVLKKPDAAAVLEDAIKTFQALEPFTAASTEEACKALAARRGVKNGAVFHPVRVAVSGRTQGPSLFHMLELLGKQKSLERIQKTLQTFFKNAG